MKRRLSGQPLFLAGEAAGPCAATAVPAAPSANATISRALRILLSPDVFRTMTSWWDADRRGSQRLHVKRTEDWLRRPYPTAGALAAGASPPRPRCRRPRQ